VNRREFVMRLGSTMAACPLAARAQQPARIRRIGLLLVVAADDPEFKRRVGELVQGLRELGWIEGRTIEFEPRYAEGKPDRLPALAAELVHAKVDVIATQGTEAIEAARKATSTIPIVMASVGDAVGQKIAVSLARPGGNVTGLSLFASEQGAKRLELIKEIIPRLTRFAVIFNGNIEAHRLQLQGMEGAAAGLGIVLQALPVRNAEDIDAAFQAVDRAKAQVIVSMEDPLIQFHRARIVELAMKRRLPLMAEFRPIVVAGALLSYGPDQVDMWRRSSSYVDRILKGANPAELPIERPTRFLLVLNMKTAKALGITIPQSVHLRVDEKID
jgi:putative ABC transport system substrate-binding protein